MNQAQWFITSKIGPLYLVASEKGLQSVFWRKQVSVPLLKSLKNGGKTGEILAAASQQLSEYFNGRRTQFDLPLDIAGTEFQKQVWAQLRQIPYGETRSYRDIASAIHNDKAMRAVGNANGKNPLTIIIPCHRVIAADGTLGGYTGGLEFKTQLLELERRHRQDRGKSARAS